MKEAKEKLIELGSDIKKAPGTIKGMIKDHIIDEPSNKLISATSKKQYKTVQLLISLGVNVNATDTYQGKSHGVTALMVASGYGDEKMVKLLLDAKAEVNAADDGGRTALIRAAHNGYPNIVSVLLEADAQADMVDKNSFTALDHALQMQKGNPTKSQYADIVALLEAHTTIIM